MAQTSSRADPFVAFRFEIDLDDLPVAGFSECTGLALETEVQEYNEGGQNAFVHRFPGRVKQSKLTLKRGVVDRGLWDWFYGLTQGIVRYRNGSIVVRDPAGGSPVMVWHFRRAFPSKWTGPDLNAAQSNVAVESLELTYHQLERQR